MSRLSQSLDVGAELERDRELRRKIAEARDGKSREDEERIEIAPKFAQEIDELVEDVDSPVRQADDDDETVIPLKRISENKAREKKAPAKKETKPARAEKPKAEKVKAEKSKAIKADKDDKEDLIIVKAEKKGKKAPEKEAGNVVATPAQQVHGPAPAGPAAPSAGPNPGPAGAPEDDGVGRLVLALLLVSIIAVVLIYAGLSQQGANAQQQPAYAVFAQENNLTLVAADNLEGAKLYWFGRAMLADNDAEAAAIMKMVLCNATLTEKSNPLNFSACPTDGMAFVVREADIINLSAPVKCDSLDDVISCENGYFVDGIVAFKDSRKPKEFLVKSNNEFTVVDGNGDPFPEALTVVSDTANNYVAYTMPVALAKTMVVKFFVGGEFNGFKRVFLDHSPGSERAAVYTLV